ncbi:L-histidine N(alpha)-methyltransferase [Nocardia terpenica]|uniref:L-histidine N(alpha)-methyltransferase n=1 Tax=Nocardia terpenica TaxID=455432 RepID=UPI0018933821|nr:L-histidine N(alpha)-methyltransferase [Nocardia terpenica]MBF6060597.1 L-histidine N(alpha)-methyltransferase [Nocardia terpenica]MBF6103857.1 L-histidine N(alpha)-methyltransferase [Nocardia terpenica]MBF6111769.1 L-histidine N(alpha)-methyltransferase [Nocardia terpenica]MBF6118078.1 L-histidine N(alpha)-methyltransferase [Nocardia terpenica]MBF6155196.1 L-histidine N(alpha)-methyltransferase [Nocardia terpenica]
MTAPTLEIHLTDDDLTEALRADARRGLTATPKWLPPKWFYDARGSELFEAITELPEYYPTRTERALLERVVGEIAEIARAEVLVELGAGSAAKTRLLLSALSAGGPLKTYVPQDVSESALRGAAAEIAAEFPGLAVHGVVSDFTDTLHNLPRGGRRMIAFLGGTIGNLVPAERAEFLTGIQRVLEPGEQLLLGAGLVIDPAVLVPAYDDAAGVTAEFNRNVLHVLNSRLHADFDPDAFAHIALWDTDNEWIEMRLEAGRDMTVTVADLDLTVRFARGEQLRTEISAKFRIDGLTAELAAAGFATEHVWTDPADRFALILAERR